MALKIVSVNIEVSRHLDRVRDFLLREEADLVCMQEVLESDLPTVLLGLPGATYDFVPMTERELDGRTVVQGIACFSRVPREVSVEYYTQRGAHVPVSAYGDSATYNICTRPLLSIRIEKEGAPYTVCTTHFTWTPDGSPSDEQRRDMNAMLSLLRAQDQFVLIGDLNAPRGGEIFSLLSERYTDAIPQMYKTSLDMVLHRAAATNPTQIGTRMVDCLFTTPDYRATDVRLVSGVSDHLAVVGTIERVVA